MNGKPGVLAVRWVPEMSVSLNGMHEIRAGAVNARERPLIGYAATYADACEIAKAHNARATVERLAKALQRVQYVRGLTGAAKAQAWDKLDGEIDAALAAFRGEA